MLIQSADFFTFIYIHLLKDYSKQIHYRSKNLVLSSFPETHLKFSGGGGFKLCVQFIILSKLPRGERIGPAGVATVSISEHSAKFWMTYFHCHFPFLNTTM